MPSSPVVVLPQTTPALPSNVVSPYRSKYSSPYNSDGTLSGKSFTWSFGRNKEYQPPVGYFDIDIRPFGGYYLGDISKKVVYLTIDCGYENGFTPQILDTLKEKGVKATFFVTKNGYIDTVPELCKRMKEEGHLVGNHTTSHKYADTLTNEEMVYEVTEAARYFKEVTGYEMDKYYRFPEGIYTMEKMNVVNGLGYKSIFWSLAYADWNRDNQPGKQAAFDHVTTYFHNGCIMLLHVQSESNAQALGDIIDYIRALGFTFDTLDNLPEN